MKNAGIAKALWNLMYCRKSPSHWKMYFPLCSFQRTFAPPVKNKEKNCDGEKDQGPMIQMHKNEQNFVPDLMVVCEENLDDMAHYDKPPLLVVEILSPVQWFRCIKSTPMSWKGYCLYYATEVVVCQTTKTGKPQQNHSGLLSKRRAQQASYQTALRPWFHRRVQHRRLEYLYKKKAVSMFLCII